MENLKTSEAQLRANKKYQEKLDVITLKIPKEDGEKIRNAAKEKGLSVTRYILNKIQ